MGRILCVGHGEPASKTAGSICLNWQLPSRSFRQDGEPVSKNAEKILEKGQEALDQKTGAVEQHKVEGAAVYAYSV